MIIQPYDMCLILWTVLKKSLCAEKCNDIKALKLWGYNNNGVIFLPSVFFMKKSVY